MADRFTAGPPGAGWALADSSEIDQACEVGMWDDDVASGRLTWDQRSCELHGTDLDSFGGTIEDYLALVHPDDRPAVRDGVAEAHGTRTSFLAEYRVFRPDGSIAWVQGLGKPVSSEDGRTTRTIGVFVDITWRRRQIETLQRAILPQTLPDLPGLDLTARYLPAGGVSQVGGDLYDVARLPDRAILLVVGDIGGHGLPAVSSMAELRHAIRAYALAGYQPSAITAQLSANLLAEESLDTTLATAVVAQLTPDARTLTWSCAGHPPPLMLAGAQARYLDEVHGSLLGAQPGAAYGQSVLDLPPDSRLLLYTDGLVERRDASLTDRLDALARAASAADHRTEELGDFCDRVLGDITGPNPEDDVCLLAVQTRR